MSGRGFGASSTIHSLRDTDFGAYRRNTGSSQLEGENPRKMMIVDHITMPVIRNVPAPDDHDLLRPPPPKKKITKAVPGQKRGGKARGGKDGDGPGSPLFSDGDDGKDGTRLVVPVTPLFFNADEDEQMNDTFTR